MLSDFEGNLMCISYLQENNFTGHRETCIFDRNISVKILPLKNVNTLSTQNFAEIHFFIATLIFDESDICAKVCRPHPMVDSV